MSVDIRQARYDQLTSISARFRSQAEQNEQMQRALQRAFQSLQSDGWKGQGAEAFFAEMQQAVFPALGRLRSALTAGDEVLREIVEVLRTAEQEAAAPFHGEQHDQPPPSRAVPTPEGLFDHRRQQHVLRAPEEVKNYAFATGRADAIRYEVEINGRRIPVYVPKNVSHDGEVHSIHEVAKALAALPESSRANIQRIDVEPKRNPQDSQWAREYKEPGFRSYMTAGADGVVQVYPTWGNQTQSQMDGALLHESGHIVSQKRWGSNHRDPRWQAWKDAMKKDPQIASTYAANSPHEDFAEAYKYYHQIKGTPKEASERRWMGERFKILDQIEAETK